MTKNGKPVPWKYELKVLGAGESNNQIHFDWGDITEAEKALITKHVTSLTKWKSKVIAVLDNPPRDLEEDFDKLETELKARGVLA